MIESLSPLAAKEPKILILGSIASGESLKKQQYYAYKYNRFWTIMFDFFAAEYSDDYEIKSQLIKQNGIALWDSISECDRENSSLDSKIKNEQPNDIPSFLKNNSSIKAIITNGNKSTSVFKKHFGEMIKELDVKHYALPSTSPANAATSLDKLKQKWNEVLESHLQST